MYDEFYKLRDNGNEINKMKALLKISKLQYKMQVLKLAQLIYLTLPLTPKTRKKVAESIKLIGYEINQDKKVSEIIHLFESWLGGLENELNLTILENDLNKKETKNIKVTFSEIIISFENKLKREISDNINLEKFVAYEKLCRKL